MSFSKKIPSSCTKCLPNIPFEVLIGCFQEKERVSFKSSGVFYSNGLGSGELRRNTFSGKTNLFSIVELRTKFEEYLYDNLSVFDSEVICQKLQFLDIFCESMKGKGKPLNQARDVFALCNNYLYELIKGNEQDGSVIIQHNILEFSFLKHFDEIVNENQQLLPVFSSHECLNSWFRAKQQRLMEWIQQSNVEETPLMDEFLDYELCMLITMFLNQMYGHFVYFQEKNVKYCKKWMKENLAELPDHLFESLKHIETKTQQFRERLQTNGLDHQFSIPTVIDIDFEILHHFSHLGNSAWKLNSSASKLNEILSFSAPDAFIPTKGAMVSKIIRYEPYNIVQLTKAMLAYKHTNKDDVYQLGNPESYQKLDVSNSSRKYSTVVLPIEFQLQKFLPKRHSKIVVTTKAKIINNELVETILLYKTCSSDVKNPYLTVGGIILQKDDKNRTRVLELKMNFLGGFLQAEFVMNLLEAKMIKKLKSLTERMMEHAKQLNFKLDEEKEMPWRTFCEYCREHCKVDPNMWD